MLQLTSLSFFSMSKLFLDQSFVTDVDNNDGLNSKGGSDPNHFISQINVGKSPIRHTTTMILNDEFLDRLQINWS